MVIKDITHLYDRCSKITNRSSNIVCIGVRWNQIEQVGGAPGVGSASSQLIPDNCLALKLN